MTHETPSLSSNRRRDDKRCLQIGCPNEREPRDGSGFCTKHIKLRGWTPGGRKHGKR